MRWIRIILVVAIAALLVYWVAGLRPPVSQEADEESVTWYCSMTVCGVSGYLQPGKCPKCGMDLIKTDASAPKTGPREYAFPKDVRNLVRVEAVAAERRPVSALVDLTGKVAIDETLRAVISARFAGRIERLYVDHVGARVRKGDHMLDIYAPDLKVSKSALLHALEREREGRPAIVGNDVENSRTRLRNWGLSPRQIEEIEKSGVVSESFTIEAPIDGFVTHRSATRGQYVVEGTPLFAVADLSRVWIELDGFETDLGLIRFGQTAAVSIPALPGRKFAGTVAFIDPMLDEHTRTVRIRLDVANPDLLLRPGMLASARVEIPLTDEGEPTAPPPAGEYICPMHPLVAADVPAACTVCEMDMILSEQVGAPNQPAGNPLVIPAEAVLSTGLRSLVYVEKKTDGITRYEAREIVPGIAAGDWTVVLEGLSGGERVVREGAFQIDSAMQIQGKFSAMQTPPENAATGRDPYFGPGDHNSDPEPGWYAAAERSDWNPRLEPSRWRAPWIDRIFDAYWSVADALAIDDDEAAGLAAKALVEAIRYLVVPSAQLPEVPVPDEYYELARDMQTMRDFYAKAVAEADGLDARRIAFRDLSGALTKLARRYGAPAGGAHLIFCPMAFSNIGAFWLQHDSLVNNPYHGLEMPRCGWAVEIIPD